MTGAMFLRLVLPVAIAVGPQQIDSNIRIEHDEDAFATTIAIRADDGHVSWSDVLRGLARARGYDDTTLEGVLPQGRIDLTSVRWRVVSTALNLALSPSIRFEPEQAEQPGGESRLLIRLDQAALLASQRRFKARLRNAVLRRRPGSWRYGILFDERWQHARGEKDLVLLVHGFNSRPEKVQGLLAAARGEGFPCACFAYPNDQPIADSARLLSAKLKEFRRGHPRRGVSLLTHSMGGLVARAAIEDPQLDPGNVRQLIMLAPPNHGSALARFAFAIEFWEHIFRGTRRKEVGLVYATVEDGLAEAAADLRPGSLFLRNLNARGRNPRVRYTVFLGTRAPLGEEDLARLQSRFAEAGEKNRWVRLFGPKVHDWLEDLDEVVDGTGDGVVSVERGKLEGVADTVVVRFSHLGVLDPNGRNDVRKVHREVLERLEGEAASD